MVGGAFRTTAITTRERRGVVVPRCRSRLRGSSDGGASAVAPSIVVLWRRSTSPARHATVRIFAGRQHRGGHFAMAARPAQGCIHVVSIKRFGLAQGSQVRHRVRSSGSRTVPGGGWALLTREPPHPRSSSIRMITGRMFCCLSGPITVRVCTPLSSFYVA